MRDTPTVFFGKRELLAKRGILLFERTIEGYVDETNHHRILQPWMEELRALHTWLDENEISDEECMLCYISIMRAVTYDTILKYYLYLDCEEHRTLFLLCKNDILDPE